MDEKIEKLILNLSRNNMKGIFAEDEKALMEIIKSLIPEGSAVGCGDSVTLEQTGVFDFLRNGNYKFLDKFKEGITRNEKKEIYISNFSAHTFITGTNAVTVKGELFNIDGNGSRVAPMIYGPGQVIAVVGKNKITDDVESAVKRTRQIAAPLDARRLNKKTPCAKTLKCVDCKHEDRICNDFVLIRRQFIKDRIKVIVVNKELGY